MSGDTLPAAAANWLWLADTSRRDRALLVAQDPDYWGAILRRYFGALDHLSLGELRSIFAGSGKAAKSPAVDRALPFDSASFDAVVLPRLLGNWNLIAGRAEYAGARAAILRECRRVLRSGGVLVVTGANPQWYAGVHVARSWMSDLWLRSAMIGAGFADVREYFADPSDLAPRSIIPACRTAAVAFERQERTMRGRGPRLLVGLGLHAMAYPARITMAFA